jgi:hypothetical protein
MTDFAYGFNVLKNSEGGVGYSNSGQWNNSAKTGGALAALSFGEKWVDVDTDATDYRNYIAKYWTAAGNWGANNAGWFGQWYAMYGLKKGLSLQGVTTLTTPSHGTRDWKKDLNGWLLGEAATIDAQGFTIGSSQRTQANMFGQLADGSWTSSLEPASLGNSTDIDTAAAILILSDAVTRAVPVAVIAPITDQTNKEAGRSFMVDGTDSYHLDADSAIAEYLWDWNASDGVNWSAPNASGALATNPGYTAIGTYTITLRVKDNKTPAATSIATTTVTVTSLDVAPIAVAKPIGGYDGYAGRVGMPITLTGTDSYDPDGDTIVSYSWDFNGDGIYGGTADLAYGDPTLAVTTVIYPTPYLGSIGLRVTANGKTSSNISDIDIQAGDADLRIDSVTYSNTVRRTTSDVSIQVTNDPASGRSFNNVLLRLYNGDPYAGGGPVGAVQTLNFSAGQTITVNLTNVDLGGAPILWAYLDTNNSVLEFDELNNISGPTRLDPEMDVEQPVGTALTDSGTASNFGTLIIGESSLKTYTITNSGTLNLTGIAATKDGTHSGDFILTQPLASSLAPGASTTFTVTYTPTAADTRTAAVHISSNDFDEPSFDIALTGFARAYPTNITLSTATINENNAANATVGTLTTTDTNVADTHTYSLVAGTGDEDNASFTIAANLLKLTPSADYETKITYNLRLRTTDQTGLTYDKAFVVTIGKLNEAPVLAATRNNPTSVESAGVATGTLGVNLFSASAVTDIDEISASLGGGNIRVTFAEYIAGDLIELPTGVTHALNAVQLSGTNVQISNGSAWTTIATRDATNTGIGKALTLTLNAAATEDNIGYVIDALMFRSTSDNPTVNQTKLTRTYSLVINDGNNNALAGGPAALDSNTIAGGTLTITPTNDFPVVDLNGATAGVNHAVTWTEVANGTHVTAAMTSSATMTDADNTHFSSMNFTLGGVLDGNSEVVTIGGTAFPLATDATNTVVTGGFKVSYNSTTDVFTIEPNGAAYATLASFQTLLNGVTYNNLTNNPTDGDRTFTVMVTDAGLNNLAGVGSVSSTLVTTTINVNPVNDQPVITDLVAASYFENAINAAAATLDATATVTDIDSPDYNGATLTVSGLVAAQDLVSLPIGAVAALDNVQLTGTNVEINDGSNWVVVGTAAGGSGNNFVVTFNASATTRSAELVIENLTFANSSNNPTLTRTLTLTLNDNDGNATQAATIGVTIKLDNDAPDITGTVGLAYTEQGAASAFVSGATASDPDQPTNFRPNATNVGNLRVALDGYVAGDLLSVANIGTGAGQIGVSGTTISFANVSFATTTGGTAADLVITFSSTTATPAAVGALINALRYRSTSDDPTVNDTDPSRVVTVTFNDGANTRDATSSTAALTDTLTGNINLTAVNDLPVIVVTGAASYSENGLALTVDGTTTVTDLDDTQMAGGSVRISTGFLSGDTLAVTAAGNVTGSYDAATGVLTLSGTDTLANYQTVLRSLTYVTANEDPTDNATKLTRVLTYSTTDANSDNVGAATGTTTKTINITPSNDKPVVTAGATLAYAENDAATAIDGTITVNDADDTQITGATATISAGLTTGDLLAVTTQNGISGSYTAGTGVLTLTGTTTLANYQTALRSVTYQSTSEDPTATALNRTVTWAVTDANSDLAGAQTSVAVTSTITITPNNDKPVVTAGATLAYTENTAATAIDATMTVSNADDTQITEATATISAGLTAGDLLAVTTQNGISGTYSAGTGVLTLTGTTTLANYQTALRSVTYQSTSEDPTVTAVNRTVTWAVTDANSDLAGAQTSVAVTSTITITPSNDKPVVTAGATLAYAENDAATAIDGTMTVNDADDTQIAGATATISAGLTTGDLLAVTTQNGISGTYTAGTGVLTLTGTATLADYQTALRSVTYESTSEDPTVTAVNRTVTWAVTDANSDLAGAQTSVAVTSTITITPSNDKPVVTAGATLAYTENTAATAIDGTMTVNDADDTQITGATATISAGLTAGDLLAVTSLNGISGTYTAGTGVLTLTGTATLADYQAAFRRVTYQSTSEDPTVTAVNRTVTWAVTDANSDLAGAQTSVAVTSTITITLINDKPVVTAGATLAYAENAAATAIDGTMTVNDADDTQIAGATATISAGLTTGDLLAVTTQNGISGIYSAGTGVLTLTGTATLADYQTALRSVTYQSTSEDPTVTAVNRTVTWAVTDANSDLAGAQTSVAVTSTITITPSNDKPVVTAGATLAYRTNAPARAIDGTMTVSDADDTQITGATATISAGLTAGDLLAVTTQNGISGTYSVGTGVLTLTGTATLANYQTALRSVTYESTSADPTVTFDRRTISWLVTDANSDLVGAETSVAVTSTISINLNETPTDMALSSATIAENNAANAIVGTLSAMDWNEGDTFTYTLVSGTGDTDNGSFTISGSSLSLTPSANYETQSSYDVLVRTTDAGGLFYEEAFTISITDVNETPTNIVLSDTMIVENNAANATVGTLSTTDADAGDTFTYTLVSGTGSTDNGSFTISDDALELTPSANYEIKSSYAVRVRTTDAGGLFYERALTITVGDVNIAVADPDNRDLNSGVSAAYAFTDPQMVGTTGTARTFTISNPGTAPLSGIQVTMSGVQSGSFVLDTSATATSLAPGETTTFSVAFAPTFLAQRKALIQVVHDGDEESPFSLGVVGTGGSLLVTLAGGELTVSDSVNRVDTLNVAVSGTDLVLTGGILITNAGTGSGTSTVRIPLASITNGIRVNIGLGGGTVIFGEMIGYTGPLTVAPAVSGDLAIRVDGSVNVGPHPITFNATQMVTISGALQASGAGLISITTRQGILINSAANLSVENGDLTLSANQALPASGGHFTGISINGASQVSSTGSGQVIINGKSGQDDGIGVVIDGGSTIRGGTTGTLAVNGLANGIGHSRLGLNISDAGTTITSLGANIALTGTGAGSLTNNHGVVINSGASVLAVGNADLTITGTGGVAGQGVRIRNDGVVVVVAVVVAVANGDLTIIGHAGSGTGAVQGFHYTGGMSGRIESTGSGDLVINADTVEMTGTGTSRGTLQTTGSGSLTIKPLTSSSSIGLGGAAGTLALSDAALAYIQNGFSSITIGDTNAGTGDVTINTVTLPDSVVLAGGIIRNAGGADVILGTGDTLTLKGTTAPGTSLGKLTVSGKLALADNETVVMEIGGLIAGSQNDQITASETVNIGSNVILNLVQVGGYIPTGTETFTLIQRSGGTGTFTGMPEGHVFANLFGSGQSATLTYLAGSSGHDVALEMGAMIPDLKIEHPVGTEIVDSLSSIDLGKAAVTKRGLTKTFTITNTGTGDVTGLALSLTGTGAGDFAFSTLAANTLAQGMTTTFTVTFTPTVLGNRTAVLHLASNINGTKNPFDIILNGTGVVSETIKPIVTITTPTSTTTEGAVAVTGTVRDALGVAMVEVKLGTGAWVESALDLNAAGTAGNYSLSITPAPGVNVMTVRATDTSGNISTLTRSFTHVVVRPLTLATAGTGAGTVVFTLPTTANASTLLLGSAYTLRATAAAGSFFNGWSSPNGSITIANPMASSLSFTMVDGAEITANFITNPFTAGITGSYTGLIKAAIGTTPAKSNTGLFTATLTSSGSFTASINLDGLVAAARGTFNPNTGNCTVSAAYGAATWNLNLHLELSGGTRRITGTLVQVTGGVTGDVSDIVANRAAFSTLNTVPVANRGTYTVALPARASQSDSSVIYPSGDGIGTVTVASTGVVTFRGTLADGRAFTQTAALSADLSWPIFIVFTSREGSLSGLATLDETQVDSDLTANYLDWYLNAGASNYFPAGWNVGIKTDLIGARYAVPVGSAVLPGLGATSAVNGNAELGFTGGNLTAGLTKNVNITTASIISRAPTTDSSFTAALAKTTGTFNGNFNHSSGGKAAYKGTILQKGANSGGYGYFLLTPATPSTPVTAGSAGAVYLLPK